jgi:tyrosyl-tRNA synthetase
MPTTQLEAAKLNPGLSFVELLTQTGLADSKSAARRLIDQGGAYLNNEPIRDVNFMVNATHLQNSELLLRAGKKKYHRVVVA